MKSPPPKKERMKRVTPKDKGKKSPKKGKSKKKLPPQKQG